MVDVLYSKEKCCGCSACKNICPKKCIKMIEDNEGFLYPKVDNGGCVNCGLCEKICPVINAEKAKNIPSKMRTYVAYISDEKIRMKSSSGGIFTALANYILENKGSIYGAAFDNNFKVRHIRIDSVNDLGMLQGSKYVQSDMGNIYLSVRKDLESGMKVLFTGTACQIAALKFFLNNVYENLITVDVLCHGVPSPLVWNKYIKELENKAGDKATDVFMRDKKYGWKLFSMSVKFKNNRKYVKKFTDDIYMKYFLKNISLRPICYECGFKDMQRPSDLTIGDCWGIENYMTDMDDDKGTSVVIIHTDKGVDIFNAVSDMIVAKEAILDRALPETAESRHSVKRHNKREEFFERIQKGDGLDDMKNYVKLSFAKRGFDCARRFAGKLKK